MRFLFAPPDVAVPQPPARTRNRLELPDRFKWNLDDIFTNWDDWTAAYNRLEQGIERYAALKGTLAQGPERLLEAFKLSEELGQLAYRVWYFPSLRYDEDQRDNTINARRQQVQLLFARWKQAESWFNPELLSIPLETVRGWMASLESLRLVQVRDRGSLSPAGTRAGRGRRAADVAGQPPVVGAERVLLGAVHRRREVSDGDALDRRGGGHLVRPVSRDSRDAARAGRSRHRVRGAAQHLQVDDQHLRHALQRRLPARLVPGARPRLQEHARGGAPRRQHSHRRRREPDHVDAGRRRAAAPLSPAAPARRSACRPIRSTTSRSRW